LLDRFGDRFRWLLLSYAKIRNRLIAARKAKADITPADVPSLRKSFNHTRKGITMDRSTTLGGNSPAAAVESTAQSVHQTVDSVADKTSAQIDRLTGSAHRAVDRAAGAAGSTLEQAREMQTRMTEAACASIRARPIATVAGAVVIGYLLGRLARL